MDFERPHHHRTPANNNNSNSNSASSELFICFSSRLSSSSSMKLSSKSILSPGRTDKQISLSASLSRRLRSNGSIKGGQSPMFPTGTKKRGCAFENTEPTSPKVTCIGQVRVKTKKKQAMKMRSMSKRRGSSGEASFRRIGEGQEEKNQQQQQQHSVLMLQRQQSQNHHLQQEGLPQRNNQKWVHLPLTICEALRAFGADFNCFLPCRSSCMSSSSSSSSSDRESKEKTSGGSMEEREAAASARSCGAVFARWLVAMQEGEAEKGREIELVVGGGGEEEDTERRRSHHRRHVMEDIDINEVERCNNEEKFGVMEEEEGNRVSICVPPKNALLLMRCRSDPVKMAALANRFWESPVTKDEDDDDREEEQKPEEKEIEEEGIVEGGLETEHNMEDEKFEDLVALHEEKEEASLVMKEEEEDEEEFQEINLPPEEEHADKPEEGEEEEEEEEEEEWVEVMEGDELVSDSSIKALVDPENHEIEENKVELVSDSSIKEDDDDENRASMQSSCSVVSVQSENGKTHEIEAEPEDSVEEEVEEEEEAEKSKSEEETSVRLSEEEETTVTMTSQRLEPETHEEEDDLERESRHHHANLERESSVLPDCLLLMMCEPKLSMEVSKETWVCSTDFIRCIPSSEKKVNKTNCRDHPPKKKSTTTTTDSNPPPHNILLQPPRSSISLPVAVASQKLSMATMIEQKLVSSVAYEPFVLTRCKSEPMRTAAVKLKPEACFWNNRKLEPHHRGPAVGVGAAGVGF